MKKLKLFISLWFTMFSVAVFAQAEFEKIAITQNTQDNLAGRLLVQDVTTGEIRYILKSVLDNKFNQPTGNATQYLDGAGNPTTFPVLGQSDRVITEVRNTTGATVTKGTVVYLTGASGGKPTIQKAQANAESTSSGTFGVIQSDINNNSNGYVVVIGTVLGVNTSSYSEGQILWLSPTTAGGFTTTKPVAPNHAVYVAIVTLASTQGTIEVKIQNGYEIDELHDVLIVSKTDNDGLIYDAASGLWKNKQITKSMVGLSNVDNTSDVNKPISTATQNALNLKENTANKNSANGYAGLGSDGKLFSTQLPSITITDTFVVGSQAAMLALIAETGDVAVRTDLNKTYILKGTDPAVLANWQELLTPTSAVTSVFGRNGAVTAQNGDYTTALVTETTNKRYQTDNQQTYNDATSSIQSQLDTKENLSNKSTSTTLGTSNNLYPTQNAVKTYVDTKVGGGVGSLEFNSTDLTVWNNGKSNIDTNTSFGDSALRRNSTGGWNTAYGQTALFSNSTGHFNTAIGMATLSANGSGQLNTALGYGSLNTSNTGNQNTGLGSNSLRNNVSGNSNSAVGYNSLGFNLTGSNNVAIGTSAGSYIFPSGDNTAVNQSVYLGAEIKTFANNQTNEVVIGYGAAGSGSNSVTLGNNSITKTLLKGTVGIGTTSPSSRLHISSSSNTPFRMTRTGGSDYSFELGASNDLYLVNNGIGSYPLTVLQSGNTGIGTMTPSEKLEVNGNIKSNSLITGITSYDSNGITVKNAANSASLWSINKGAGDGTENWQVYNFARNSIDFSINNTSGNIGIGTTAPLSGGSAAKWITLNGSTYSGGIIGSVNGTAKFYNFYDNTTNTLSLQAASGVGISFSTDNNERMRISSGGKVAIGMAPNSARLTVNGAVTIGEFTNGTAYVNANSGIAYFGNGGTSTCLGVYNNGNYYFTGSNVSDIRAKENINALNFNATEKVIALQPKSYFMKNDHKQIRYGFIAQDVYKVLPDLVKGDVRGEAFVGLDYNGIIPVLVKAMQEQQAQIKELQKEIEILKNK